MTEIKANSADTDAGVPAPALTGAVPIPPPHTAPMAERALWFAQYGHRLNRDLWHLVRDLNDHYREHGPIRTAAGMVTKVPAGYEWDHDAVAQVMPDLVGKVAVTVELGPVIDAAGGVYVGAMERADRLCELVEEEFCGNPAGAEATAVEQKRVVDGTEANRVLREGGEAAALILPHRKPKGHMGVEPLRPPWRAR